MSAGITGIIVVLSFFTLMILGLPIAFCLISSALIFTLIFWNPAALYLAATTIYAQATLDIFLAIPLFIFLAAVLEKSGIAESLYGMFYKWLGRMKGGLSIGSIFMCTIMDAISGLGASGIVTIGPIALPEMFKRKYDPRIALGSIAAGSALGPLIPPSVIMIIISGFTGLSVGKLFAAGLFPGLLCSAGFAAYVFIICSIKPKLGPPVSLDSKITWREKLLSLRAVILPLLLIMAVMGSIYTGICTPTEGAAVGGFGALISAGINRRLNFKTIYEAGIVSIKITCMVMWLLIGGSMFASLLSALGIQAYLGQILGSVQSNFGNFALLGIVMLVVFIMGMFLDGAAITVIMMPVIFPVVINSGIDPLWFGILFTINVVIGYITPPFGMNLFYMKGIAPPEISMEQIYKSISPFVVIMILVLVAVLFFPGIATWLPNKMIVLK